MTNPYYKYSKVFSFPFFLLFLKTKPFTIFAAIDSRYPALFDWLVNSEADRGARGSPNLSSIPGFRCGWYEYDYVVAPVCY